MEIWESVPHCEGYEVSNQGRVRSYRDRQGHPIPEPRVLTPRLVKGYPSLNLGGHWRQPKVHTLVLSTFVGFRPEGQVCRHLDGNPLNNHLENLKWGTLEENYDDRRHHGTDVTGVRNGRAKLDEDKVREIRALKSEGLNVDEIASRIGISRATVNRVCSGRSWAHVS